MSNATANTRKQRRRWSAADKALIVRRYLRDNVALADLADETGASPGQICQWAKALLENAEVIFSGDHKKIKRQTQREIQRRDDRILQLQEVVSELSTVVLELKKNLGPPFRAACQT